ncbi:hypothetical protein CISG_00208 [Coccidioides immitis RMSCC 3703]|uniref:Uncharacterized protein n=2 Tax=Coccidioides immitis TaxID=5501 RepID=A0A0J8QHS0_COCIT|nr:hypothetical protein CIRG_07331 [Coccidioides immitis RMSCC 2394]KMU71899.1 hypothetical protein CISG_00208 [Coccidioides immitis RMSCC 3703]
MEVHSLFQLTASAAACLISGGGGHAVWLSSIARRVTWRPASLNQTAVLCQAGVGLLVFAGSVASLVLAVYEPVFNKDEQQSLDLYLSLSTLHSRSSGIFSLSVILLKVLVLLLFFVNGISPGSRRILYSLSMVFTSGELVFLCAWYIRLWVSCARSANEPLQFPTYSYSTCSKAGICNISDIVGTLNSPHYCSG